MYAIPHQTKESFSYTLSRAISLAPTHISAYSLKVEEGTPFARMGDSLPLPDEDQEVALYEMCVEVLGDAGYHQYEISNYARKGMESRHNLRYWKMSPYIGIGVAAYSYFEGKRYGCDRDLDAYLHRIFTGVPQDIPQNDRDTTMYETVMLGLRLAEGIGEQDFRDTFGVGFYETYGGKIDPLLKTDLLVYDGERVALTSKGMYVSLAILSHILSE
jgi:oxygen-independent coproporphyrinogen-3 oxidase